MPRRAKESLSGAWRASRPEALALLGGDARDAEARAGAVAAARALHPAAREALEAQNPDRAELVRKLVRGVAVVTGQQPCLFGGPLYTLLKAASAIGLAARLERETGREAVAVFWVQEEDHDLDEVRHHTVLGADDTLVEVKLGGEGGRRSLAHQELGPTSEALAALGAALAPSRFGTEVSAILEASYRGDRGYSSAFVEWLRRAIPDAPLLVLRPRTAVLAEATVSIHRRAIEEAEAIEAALRARAEMIEAAGFSVQVPIRAGAALSFFHPDGPEGPRFRISGSGDSWALAGDGRVVSRATLARSAPLAFSSSALLRPIVQDTLLPTAAIVAGPSELAYLAELPPLYAHFGLPQPLFVPRAHGRWLPDEDAALLTGAATSPETFAPTGSLARSLLGETPELASLLALPGSLAAEIEARRAAALRLDPSLAGAIDKTLRAAAKSSGKLASRALRVALSQDDRARERLRALKARHLPANLPQERGLGWPSIAARVGPDALATALEGVDPLERGAVGF